MKSILTFLGPIVFFAEVTSATGFNLKPNVYYTLTPELALELGIDLVKINTTFPTNYNEEILVKVNELDELDLSIHEIPAMNFLVVDNMR